MLFPISKTAVGVSPEALYHIIVRGIERRRIFSDDQDRDNFIERLGEIVTETQPLQIELVEDRNL